MNKEMKEKLCKVIKFLVKAQEIITSDGETEFLEIKRKNRQEIGMIFGEMFPDYDVDGDTEYSYGGINIINNDAKYEIYIRFYSHCESCMDVLDDPYKMVVEIYCTNGPDIDGIDGALEFLRSEVNAPVQMINLTPHEVTFYDSDGVTVLSTVPSSGVARAKQLRETIGDVNGIPVCKTSYGAVEGLPSPKSNTIYIVSVLTAQAALDRNDLYIVDDTVRDDAGRILGCKALAKI